MKMMLKVVAMIIAGVVLLTAIGCGESEYKKQQRIEIKDHIIHQDTIVE